MKKEIDKFLSFLDEEVIAVDSCIIPAIWRAYWRLRFDYSSIDDQTILDLALEQV